MKKLKFPDAFPYRVVEQRYANAQTTNDLIELAFHCFNRVEVYLKQESFYCASAYLKIAKAIMSEILGYTYESIDINHE